MRHLVLTVLAVASLFTPLNAAPSAPAMAHHSWGIGISEKDFLAHFVEYDWGQYGGYVTLDLERFANGFGGHVGLAMQSGRFAAGAGAGYRRPWVDVHTPYGNYQVQRWVFGPHVWIEYGPPIGPAPWIGYGVGGFEAGARYRF